MLPARTMTRAELLQDLHVTDLELTDILDDIAALAATVNRPNPVKLVGPAGPDQLITLDDAFATLLQAHLR
jgi:hypothetical protein